MSEDRETQDRWRALAEELGLPADAPETKTAAAAAAAPPPPTTAEPPVAPAPLAEPASLLPPLEIEKPVPLIEVEPAGKPCACEPCVCEQRESPVMEHVELPPITSLDSLDEPGISAPDFAQELPAEDLTRPGELGTTGEASAEEAHTEESRRPAAEERSRGRGGRRGQRGRRGRGGERSGEVREAGPSEEAGRPAGRAVSGRDEEAPREERHRRGQGRRPAERSPEPEESFVEVDEEETSPAVEEDDAPEDNLADLNVPAWTDLIASLYRPDR